MNYSVLTVTYANPANLSDIVDVEYAIHDTKIAQKWASCLHAALQNKYPIDDPTRFYNFNDKHIEEQNALCKINDDIRVINDELSLGLSYVTDVSDQDMLNHLHYIFETYHGHLNQQSHFSKYSEELQKALASLNVSVHRCESVDAVGYPRQVVTNYRMPKAMTYDDDDYMMFTDHHPMGSVFACYAEIGKTMTDMCYDNDHHMTDEAFKPFHYISSDFEIRFYDTDFNRIMKRRNTILEYYRNNKSFFGEWKPSYAIGRPLVGIIKDKTLLSEIYDKQYTLKVDLE